MRRYKRSDSLQRNVKIRALGHGFITNVKYSVWGCDLELICFLTSLGLKNLSGNFIKVSFKRRTLRKKVLGAQCLFLKIYFCLKIIVKQNLTNIFSPESRLNTTNNYHKNYFSNLNLCNLWYFKKCTISHNIVWISIGRLHSVRDLKKRNFRSLHIS